MARNERAEEIQGIDIPIGVTDVSGGQWKAAYEKFKHEYSDKVLSEIEKLNFKRMAGDDPGIKALEGGLAKLQARVAGPQGLVEGLKSALGENSPFSSAMKILSGTGALAGVTIAVQAFEHIRELGADIHEFITGDAAYFKEMTEEANKTTEYINKRRELLKQEQEVVRHTADLWAEIRGERELIGLSGATREDVITRQQDAKALREIEDKRKADKTAALQGQRDAVAKLRADLAEAVAHPFEADQLAYGGVDAYGKPVNEYGQAEAEADQRSREAEINAKITAAQNKLANQERDYDAESKRLLDEKHITQLRQAQERAINRARDADQKRRQDLREIEQRQNEARRAGMQPDVAKAYELDESYRAKRDDIKAQYEERTRGMTDPDAIRREQQFARDLLQANESNYAGRRKTIGAEQQSKQYDVFKDFVNSAVAATVTKADTLAALFGPRTSYGAGIKEVGTGLTYKGGDDLASILRGIAHGGAEVGQSILDAVTLRKFLKDQEDSADYLKRMWELMRKQSQPKIFNGKI